MKKIIFNKLNNCSNKNYVIVIEYFIWYKEINKRNNVSINIIESIPKFTYFNMNKVIQNLNIKGILCKINKKNI